MPTRQGSRPDPLRPPENRGDMTSDEWANWFYNIYETLFKQGARVDRVSVTGKDGTGTFSAEKWMAQGLLSLDCGLFADYSSNNGSIIYGYAASVRRSAGNSLTVGAQINAYGPKGGAGGVFGIATEAIGPDGFLGPLVGLETTAGNLSNANLSAKIGHDSVFKDRGDGVNTVFPGVGSDKYNYYSSAHWITSQARSLSGERCGWTRGVSFLGQCMDEQLPPAWNAAVSYNFGQVVSSGGVLWQAIQTHINQVPAVPSVYWVQSTPAGVFGGAIGIDFSSVPISVIARTSSAIRLRDGMRIDYDCTGAIGSLFDNVAGVQRVVDNAGNLRMGVDVASGELHLSRAIGGAPGGLLGYMPFTHTIAGACFLAVYQ